MNIDATPETPADWLFQRVAVRFTGDVEWSEDIDIRT